MYRRSYPACEIEGSREPVVSPSGESIPQKCLHCEMRSGVWCSRAEEQMGRKQLLDAGACFKEGPISPVPVREEAKGYFLYVPAKCQDCEFLSETPDGFFCAWEQEKWGATPRSLDWGDFEPRHPLLGHEKGYHLSPRVLRLLGSAREGEALVLFRQMNPEVDYNQARKLIKALVEKAQNYQEA